MRGIVKNARIISPGFCPDGLMNIYMSNGRIDKITPKFEPEPDDIEIDADGKTVIPGLIDMHCNICDPGYEHIEDIETASMAAACGGFSTITCDPNTKPVIDNKTVVEYILSKNKACGLINILPFGSMTIGCKGEELSEIGEMNKVGIVGISDGGNSVCDANFLRQIFKYSLMFDLPVITHCEDKNLSGKGVLNEGYTSTRLGLVGMPREAETVIAARNIVLAEGTGCRLHIAQVSTKETIQLIREAKGRGVNVTCETSPHYFILTEKSVGEYNTIFKINPPLRTEADIDAIKEGLADGTIDVIASGHSPSKLEYKKKEFDAASYGISAIETAFPLSYTFLVETGVISLPELIKKMSLNPANILGLKNKGVLSPGADADIIIIEDNKEYTINAAEFSSKAKFSPFAGYNVKGGIMHTIVGGKLIF